MCPHHISPSALTRPTELPSPAHSSNSLPGLPLAQPQTLKWSRAPHSHPHAASSLHCKSCFLTFKIYLESTSSPLLHRPRQGLNCRNRGPRCGRPKSIAVCSLLALEAGSPKSGCRLGRAPCGGSRGGPFLPLRASRGCRPFLPLGLLPRVSASHPSPQGTAF